MKDKGLSSRKKSSPRRRLSISKKLSTSHNAQGSKDTRDNSHERSPILRIERMDSLNEREDAKGEIEMDKKGQRSIEKLQNPNKLRQSEQFDSNRGEENQKVLITDE